MEPAVWPLVVPEVGVTLSQVPLPKVEAAASKLTPEALLELIWTCCEEGASPPAVVVKNKPVGTRSGAGAVAVASRFKTAVTYCGEFRELESAILTIA